MRTAMMRLSNWETEIMVVTESSMREMSWVRVDIVSSTWGMNILRG